ncbi:MAG: arginase/agmatinase/formimionoglutamate hydrolase arginase family-like protein, partial [Conexibacter sp.]|nr:arginase/agmatinase/formimionoglutamate hydrolase arginase family-like protein [Conexibacter sp.]
AAEVEQVEGWLLRRTDGVDRRRCNSLLPPADAAHAARTVELALATADELDFTVAVQVSPAEGHLRLDEVLEARGMTFGGPSLVLAGPLGAGSRPGVIASRLGRTDPGLGTPGSRPGVTASRLGRIDPGLGAPGSRPGVTGSWLGGTGSRPGHVAPGVTDPSLGTPGSRPGDVASDPGHVAPHSVDAGARPAPDMTIHIGDGAPRPGPVASPPALAVQLEDLSADWVAAWGAVSGIDGTRETADLVLSQLGDRARFASAVDSVCGDQVGVCIGVEEEGWLGLFSLAVDPDFRRRGVATALVEALEQWAASRGATGAYLQVEADNSGALDFYGRRGFHIAHSYHYRSA